MYEYSFRRKKSSFLDPSEILLKRSCDCDYAVKVKFPDQNCFYFCPRCHSKIESIKNDKKVINLENLEFDDIDDLFDYQMILAIGSVINHMIDDLKNDVHPPMHARLETTQMKIAETINTQIEQGTNSVKKKLLKKYKSLETLSPPRPIPKD